MSEARAADHSYIAWQEMTKDEIDSLPQWAQLVVMEVLTTTREMKLLRDSVDRLRRAITDETE